MLLKSPANEVLPADVTTSHPASSYGRPVVVVGGQGCGPEDLPGWTVVQASGQELHDLRRAGYELPQIGPR